MRAIFLALLFVGLIFGLTQFLIVAKMGLLAKTVCFFVGIGVIWSGFTFSSSVSK